MLFRTGDTDAVGFSWGFLRAMSAWTMRLASIAAVVGLIVTRDPAFALGCLVGAGADVLLVRRSSASAERALAENSVAPYSTALLLAGRVVLKAALLGVALLVPQVLDFWGTAIGVLAYDVTLAVVGSILVVKQGMRDVSEGR
jgi:hypothetical protein